MSINITNPGVAGITVESDPTALKLTGGSLSGKVNMAAPTAGGASLNLGVGTSPTTSVAGDIWIGANIVYKASDGVQKTVANLSTANFFTGHQVIHTVVGTTFAALRVTQLGTGNAIEVEDSTTPDATRFVVDQHGKVGIGVAPDVTAALKVDANGIMFSDGSIQTIAGAVGPAGPAGPAGANATAWVYKGAYDGGYTYAPNDFVTYDGSSYVMISFIGAAGYAPPGYPGSWQLVASIGATGPAGPTGVTGDTGAPGTNGTNGTNGANGGNFADAPNNGNYYVRQNEQWLQVGTTSQFGYNVLYII